ncbi:MAG: 2Fe-2S iron-sulfur cluster-binding protein [Bdellovibrionota bacterium]
MKVKFVPQNIECEIKPGQSVMHVAQDNGIYIKSVCKGVPSCAECRVRIIDGEHNVLPPGSEELSLIGTGHFIDRRRLSCQLKCFGDITVDMNEQIAKEQGLIGKKSKRIHAKDDRVEEAVARRSPDVGDTEPLHTGEAPSQTQVPQKPRDQKPRDHKRAERSAFQADPEPKRHGNPPPPKGEQGPDRNEGRKSRRRRRGKGGGGGAGAAGGGTSASGSGPGSGSGSGPGKSQGPAGNKPSGPRPAPTSGPSSGPTSGPKPVPKPNQ